VDSSPGSATGTTTGTWYLMARNPSVLAPLCFISKTVCSDYWKFYSGASINAAQCGSTYLRNNNFAATGKSDLVVIWMGLQTIASQIYSTTRTREYLVKGL
jgi:hypothetical protein